MGTTVMQKPDNVSEWMKKTLTWESERSKNVCLDVAIVERQTGYAAVETTYPDGRTEVWAAVFALGFYPRARWGETFSYKDMTESMGPRQTDCPRRILERLTPTDNKYANEWRAKCWERIHRRENNKLKPGDYIRFAEPLKFTDSETRFDTFRYDPIFNRDRFVGILENGYDGLSCRIRRWRDREFVKLEEDDIPRPPQPRM